MKHTICAQYDNVRIRPLEKNDIENLRNWRNNAENTTYLRKLPYITPEMQLAWYEKYLEDQDQVIFAIDEISELNRMVGSIALYNFRGDVAECGSFMIADPATRGKGVGLKSIVMCLYAGFECLGLTKYDASVHEENMAARITDEKAGFLVTGKHPYVNGGYELEIELPKEHFYKVHDFLSKLQLSGGQAGE